MELRQLAYVVALAEELHFGRAAKRMHIVQSALSQQVRRLERDLGVQLFERTTHYVRLTRAGDAFVTEARRVLAAADAARRVARGNVADELRVGVADPSIDTMPTVLAEIQSRFPNLVIHEVDGGLTEQRRAFAAGQLDLALTHTQDATLLDPDLVSEVIRVQPFGAYVASASPLAERDTLVWSDLDGATFLFAPERLSPEFNRFFVDLLESAGIEPRRYAGTTSSVNGAFTVVARGGGVLMGPEVATLPSGVTWRPMRPRVDFTTRLVRRRDEESPLIEAALQVARDVAAREAWLGPAG